jgi:hypothetical protein
MSTETTVTGGTTSIIMATDLLSSLPALQSIPQVLLDAGADRSEWDLRQCLEQQAPSSSTNGTEVAHHKIFQQEGDYHPLAGSNSSRSRLADHISARIAKHQEERYQPKGKSVRYRYRIDEEPNTTTRKNDNADDNDADEVKVEDLNRLTLRTYVERIDSHNCTSTYLSEVYEIETTTSPATAFDPTSSTTATVSGYVRLHTFFYGEEGDMITNNGAGLVNVQTQLERHFTQRTIVVQAAVATVGSNKNQEEEETEEEPHHDSVNTTSGSSVSGGQPHQADPSAAAATTTTRSNMESLATAIVRALVQFVDEQVLLPPAVHPPQEAIATAASSLQRLRRVLPITKMRFRWDAAAQRHVQLLNGRQQQEQR